MAEAELTTIARPYARAAFSHALDSSGGLGVWSDMLRMLAEAVKAPTVQTALENPRLTTNEEAGLLVRLMGDNLTPNGQNFIGALAEHGRLTLLPRISELFELLKSNHEKTMEVEVTSAFEVSDGEKADLATALQRKLQRVVHIETKTDKTLIGGVIIKAEDTVIDDSVRGRLAKLSRALS